MAEFNNTIVVIRHATPEDPSGGRHVLYLTDLRMPFINENYPKLFQGQTFFYANFPKLTLGFFGQLRNGNDSATIFELHADFSSAIARRPKIEIIGYPTQIKSRP